jgi:hypothetical protein
MTDGPGAAEGGATSELMSAISEDVRRLIREELRRARTELGDSMDSGRRAAALLGGAAVFGALSAGTSAALLVRILDSFLPRPVAGLVATGLFGAAAGALARSATAELQRVRQELTGTEVSGSATSGSPTP